MRFLRFDIIVYASIAVVIIGIVGAAAFFAQVPKPYAEIPVLSPEEHDAQFQDPANGFHKFKEALYTLTPPDATTKNNLEALAAGQKVPDATSAYLEAQQPTFELIDQAINSKHFIVPRVIPGEGGPYDEEMDKLRLLRNVIKGKAATLNRQNKLTEAVELCLNTARLSHLLGIGGTSMDAMMSFEFRRDAMEALLPILDKLDESELDRIVVELRTLESDALPFDQFDANTLAISEYILSENTVIRGFQNWNRMRMTEATLSRIEIFYNLGITHIIGTRLRAQVLLYERQHDSPPPTLADALDSEAVPIDPLTNALFQLRSDNTIRVDAPNDDLNSLHKNLVF